MTFPGGVHRQGYLLVGLAFVVGLALLKTLTWTSSAGFHTSLELIASVVASVVGVIALTRFYSRRSNMFLFLGTGFLGAAALDLYDTVVTSQLFSSHLPSALPSLIPWSWVASRLFLSIWMCLTWYFWRREKRLGSAGKIGAPMVYLLVGALVLATGALFAFVPMPEAHYPDAFFHRPEDLLPGGIFTIALVAYLNKGWRGSDPLEHWIVIFLIVSVVCQVAVMPFSVKLFDPDFDIAHSLKIVSYLCVFVGLLTSVYAFFRESDAKAEELETKISERTAELARRNAELVRSNRDLDDFAYVASHDLKAPLRDIDNLATWLADDLKGTLPEASEKHLSQLQGRVLRLERFLEDLLQYSRVGRFDDEPEKLDLTDLFREVAELVCDRGSFLLTLPEEVPEITAPRIPLEQTLVNLVSNAMNHHDRGSGLIDIQIREEKDFFEFSVCDDGPGVPEEYREQVFGMFRSLRRRDESAGTGIGLAVVKKWVESAGGRVWIEANQPRGAWFRFTWPRVWVENVNTEARAADDWPSPR